MKRTLSTCLSAGIPESCSSWKRNPVKFSSSQGLRFTTARTPLSASTPVLVVLDPVLSQLRRPVRHFALRVTCQIVEVQNLYDNSRRHRVFTDLRNSTLHGDKDMVFHCK